MNPTFFLCVSSGWVIGWWSTSGAKTQTVRLIDVGVIGPLLILMGALTWRTYGALSWALVFVGSTTISYNLKNYLHQRAREN